VLAPVLLEKPSLTKKTQPFRSRCACGDRSPKRSATRPATRSGAPPARPEFSAWRPAPEETPGQPGRSAKRIRRSCRNARQILPERRTAANDLFRFCCCLEFAWPRGPPVAHTVEPFLLPDCGVSVMTVSHTCLRCCCDPFLLSGRTHRYATETIPAAANPMTIVTAVVRFRYQDAHASLLDMQTQWLRCGCPGAAVPRGVAGNRAISEPEKGRRAQGTGPHEVAPLLEANLASWTNIVSMSERGARLERRSRSSSAAVFSRPARRSADMPPVVTARGDNVSIKS
jgi:hypothetical protein